MTGRTGVGSDSVWEMMLIPLLVAGIVGAGLLWLAGLIVGSFLGAALPGRVGEGFAAVLSAFPSVGEAWTPAIPSGTVWIAATALAVGLAPVGWRLARSGRAGERGAEWANTGALRRAGLLMPDGRLPHAHMEDPDAGP